LKIQPEIWWVGLLSAVQTLLTGSKRRFLRTALRKGKSRFFTKTTSMGVVFFIGMTIAAFYFDMVRNLGAILNNRIILTFFNGTRLNSDSIDFGMRNADCGFYRKGKFDFS
jgi:hypothetical protein